MEGEEPDWEAEAAAVIQDVRAHVKNIQLSAVPLPSRGVYINITTLESQRLCVLLGPSGFQVVGNAYDDISLENLNCRFYETPYSLLSAVSPSYDQSFGNLLVKKLNELNSRF
ncbi:GSK3B-interacting protein [Macrosteles quadrilineatus]|uniref:GSK3B-interacting protein n=1 Tax=Macrosteles quadrilineatus TaxID=74068 RepID=UPI0023E0D898|nr:GSK3B-interacting protein [Macrosteles quadrilineatus]XP_054269572.1 GSK3B-interacting protein [Macrosteles quadrilineatus]XP_054269573.1 GSK3B-interacting protein [Macrosteles quadrilineatus]